MRTQRECRQAWLDMYRAVEQRGHAIIVPKGAGFPHPRDAGALPTTTWPAGQVGDYMLEVGVGIAPLLVREFADRFEAFVVGVQLVERVFQWVDENPDSASFIGGALLGAMTGAAIGRNRNGALLGAGVGLLIVAVARYSTKAKRVVER